MKRIEKKFTKAKKKDALEKIAVYVGDKLRRFKYEQKYTYSEIAEAARVLHPRISDITRNGVLPEKVLVGLISGGIVTTEELLQEMKGQLDEGQEKYVETFVVHEMGRFKRMAVEMVRRGDNPEKALEQYIVGKYGEEALEDFDKGK